MKRLIRILCSSVTATVTLAGMVQVGTKLRILRTMEQGNVCMALGGLLIIGLSIKVLMEKDKIAVN